MRLVAFLLAALLLLVPAAYAQEPGVTIDPDSPSAKEYEIPIESARRGAEPGRDPGAPVQSGERGAPLFGAGVSGGEPGEARRERRRDEEPAATPTQTPRPDAPEIVRAAASNPGAPAGGTGTNALVIAGGIAVLGVGAGLGLLARRRG
jgi:hypothetical protein